MRKNTRFPWPVVLETLVYHGDAGHGSASSDEKVSTGSMMWMVCRGVAVSVHFIVHLFDDRFKVRRSTSRLLGQE